MVDAASGMAIRAGGGTRADDGVSCHGGERAARGPKNHPPTPCPMPRPHARPAPPQAAGTASSITTSPPGWTGCPSRWHWRVCGALGIAWVLDGLEVTLAGSLGAVLQRPDTLSLSAARWGWLARSMLPARSAGPGVRPARRQSWPQAPAPAHAAGLPAGHACHCHRPRLRLLRRLPLLHRAGHRWRICSHQFRHR